MTALLTAAEAAAMARRTNKRQTPAPIPRQLLAHLWRWSRAGGTHVVGADVLSVKTGWTRMRRDAGLGADVVPHILRHTAITWGMQRGMSIEDASGFFGVSVETLQRTYWHHSPAYMASAKTAMERRS